MKVEVEYRALALLKTSPSTYEFLEDALISLPADGTVAQLEDGVKKDLAGQRSEFRRPDDILASTLLVRSDLWTELVSNLINLPVNRSSGPQDLE